MLKRAERLTRHDFGRVAMGRTTHTPLFTVRLLPIYGAAVASKKFSVVVSKKVAKTAVARNALRRKVYAAINECGPLSVHGILYMKPEAVSASYEAIRASLLQVLRPVP